MQNENEQTISNVISLKDVVGFFNRNRWRIVVGIFAGLLFSTAYVLLAQKKYEAKGYLQMAQIVTSLSNSINFSAIEEPVVLIQRLRFSSSYPVAVQQSCGMPKNGEFGEYLGGILDIQAVKKVPNAIEIRVRTSSVDQAKQCAEAIVSMIIEQQGNLIRDHFAGRQEQLLRYQRALREEQQQLEKIRKSELANFGYLARLDQLSWLRTRVDTLQEEALLSQKHPAQLISPITASSEPVSPKTRLLSFLGLSLGLMLGMLYAFGRESWRRAT